MSNITGFRTDRSGAYIEHDPDSRLDYSLDWSEWLSSGDTLSASTWTVSTITGDSAPITVESVNTNSNTGITTAILSGGTAGNIYTVKCRITTGSGLIDERTFRLVVRDRSL